MSLTQWTQYVSGTPTVEINFVTPIADAGSLRIACSSGQKALLLSTLYTLGLTKGRMRSLFRVDDVTGPDTYRYGFTLFQSIAGIIGTGYAYLFGIEVQSSMTMNTPFFDICTTGLDEGRTRYFTGSTFTRINGTTIVALEVEWAYEPTVLGGTRFILRKGHGTLTDFSNLVDIGTVELYPGQGVTPFLSTSAAEGIYSTGATTSTIVDVRVDSTKIIKLT